MSSYSSNECELNNSGHCITCSDEALPAKVLHIEASTRIALVIIGEARTEVDVSLVEDIIPGDVVLVHGGVAIERLDSELQNKVG